MSDAYTARVDLCPVCVSDACVNPSARSGAYCTRTGCYAPHDEHRDEESTCQAFTLTIPNDQDDDEL
ncbi:hypothetical protein [Streptomyces sp. NPDC127103]|uniref:hypothetical protein n=1 Tax=Streptomyces sp. NPDC127103 TaxID=3347139 RepID=UPI0036467CB6